MQTRKTIATLMFAWCWAQAGAATVQWFDGQGMQTAWVNDATGAVALEQGGLERALANTVSIVTQPGRATAVAQTLESLGFVVKPSPIPDKLYVLLQASSVLGATQRMTRVQGIQAVQLQWARHVAMPKVTP